MPTTPPRATAPDDALSDAAYTAGLTASNGGGGDTASIEGTVRINGDIILNGISVSGHVHPGDSGGTTGSMQAG